MKKPHIALIISGLLVALMGACGEVVIIPIEQRPKDDAAPGGPKDETTPGGPSTQPPPDDGPDRQEAEAVVPVPYQGNTCQCMAGVAADYHALNGPGWMCTSCLRMQGQDDPDGPCRQEFLDCYADPVCDWIWIECLSENEYDPAIIASCILPFDKDPGHKKFQAWAECSCARCTDSCVYPEPVECVAPE